MGKQAETLAEEVRSNIIRSFKEGKFVSEITKKTNLSRSEVKDTIEDYLNSKMVSEDKTV